jgi:hypothetical protein
MMKSMILALLALAVSALPTFAADDSAPGPRPTPGMHAPDMKGDMKHMMHQNPEMHQEMMKNPKHLLAMAYHKNIVSFGKALQKVAQQGDTVPRDFARAAIVEMRRSAVQMEIYHEEAARAMSPELKAKHGEMAKAMEAHLTEMRTQLTRLEEISKGERINSTELLQSLDPLLKSCAGMHGKGMHGEGMHRGGMHGKGMHCEGMRGKGMDCCCGQGSKRHMRSGSGEGCRQMMQERQKMMEEMKVQDAEISRLVTKMNSAPNDLKQSVMADILTRIVKQHADMAAHMEKMQEHMKHQHMGGAGMSPCQMQVMDSDAAHSEDADSNDDDSDDMDSDETDDDSDGGSMDMRNMNMQQQ